MIQSPFSPAALRHLVSVQVKNSQPLLIVAIIFSVAAALAQVPPNDNFANRIQLLPTGTLSTNIDATSAVALGDMNSDGRQDVVVGNFGQRSRLFLNNATTDPFGSVLAKDITTDVYNTVSIAVGDVNGDTRLDVVTGNLGQPKRLYLNNGTANPFNGVVGQNISADTNNSYSVVLADVNGDSRLDVISGNGGSPAQVSRLYLNNGTADPFNGVAGVNISAEMHDTRAVAVADVTGDGRRDIVLGNFNEPPRLYTNNGTANPFNGVTGVNISADAFPTRAVLLSDVNGDGRRDLVTGNLGRPIRFYTNNGTASPFNGVTGSNVSPDTNQTTSLALADVDSDDEPDLVAGNNGQPSRLYLSNGTDNSFAGVFGTNIAPDALATLAVALGELDGDGEPDLVVGNSNLINRVYFNSGTEWRFTPSTETSNIGATREAAEPQHSSSFVSSNSIWFTWTAPSSGGAVLRATVPFDDFSIPVFAVYTGNSLASLIKLASNHSPFSNNGNNVGSARVVFAAVAGQTYQIAVDGIPDPNVSFDTGDGEMLLLFTLYPPPANDLFANGTMITGTLHEGYGSFLGANRESGEPSHGTPAFGQTLWWTWIAPSNGLTLVPTRLTADGVSFPPGMAVYLGNSVSALTPVSLSSETNGLTRAGTFTATAGTTYHIALAGLQNDETTTASRVGDYRIRLNCRALSLSITNRTAVTNGDESVSVQADARIENLGAAASNPLRVYVSAISGVSLRGEDETPTVPMNQIFQGVWPSPPVVLGPGQTTNVHVSGVVPAPFEEPGNSVAEGYGLYAELQEQPFGNNWFTVDQVLVSFGEWPDFGGIPGPGGGVIRLDPAYIGLSSFNPLQSVIALGPASVTEGTIATYTGRATYTDGAIHNFSNTLWSASHGSITTNGLFSTGIVTSNTLVTLVAPYSSGGLLYGATTNVTVINLPPPTITNLSLLGDAGIVFTLSGVAGRSNVIEATTNLAAPAVWLPLITNAPASGLFNFTNFSRTNFPHRFYRAREQ